MAGTLHSVNVASAAVMAFATIAAATRGPIFANPEFAVGGALHPAQGGAPHPKHLHHNLRYPARLNAEVPEPKQAAEVAAAPAPASDIAKDAHHADAAPDEHSGKPGEGGDPMVPRTHEHGDIEADHNYGWSYASTQVWGKSYKTCVGKRQSPINLPSNVRDAKDAGSGNVSTLLSYSPLSNLHIDNNGHNLQVNGEFGNLTLASVVYQAVQFNLHFPSEHEVDGERAAGEIQIVHQKLGADGTNGLAILAILVNEEELSKPETAPDLKGNICAELALMKQLGFPHPGTVYSYNPELTNADEDDEIKSEEQLKEAVESEEEEKKEEEEDQEHAEAKEEEKKEGEKKEEHKALLQVAGDPPSAPAGAPGASPAVPFAPAPAPAPAPVLPEEDQSLPILGGIDLSKTYAHQFEGGYYHYKGSLTTPPCSETVEWLVLDRRGTVTPAMVKAFKKLFPDPANSRPVQPINDREIVWSKEEVPEELPAKSAANQFQAGLGLSCIWFVLTSCL